MKTLYWLPLAALAAFAGDCGDPIVDDTDIDSDTEFEEFFINSLNVSCVAGTPDTVTADVVFAGWADTVTMTIVETGAGEFDGDAADFGGAWDETHIFPADANVAFAADGSSDTWQFVITDVATPAEQIDGSTTLLGCGGSDSTNFWNQDGSGDAASNTYDSIAVRVEATPDDSARDSVCAMFGHKAEEAYGADCECFEAFLTPTPAAPCQ